jgi:dipeptidyl aminopeptidase/acylaminoacyl peptidase
MNLISTRKVMLSVLTAALTLPTVAAADSAGPAAQAVSGSTLIPRSALFGNPEKTQARISPDGKYISYIAPREGVLNVWVAERGKLDAAKPLTNDQKRGIRQHMWAFDNRHVLYQQDEGGDENWHIHAVDVTTGVDRDITPYKGARADISDLSWRKPGIVAVNINDRDPEWADLYEIDIATGKRTLVEKNTDQIAGWILDFDLKPKMAQKNDAEGSEVFRRVGDKWVSVFRIGQEDSLTTAVLGIEANGTTALLQSSVGRDKAALERLDIATGKTTVLGQSDRADVDQIWVEPKTAKPQAYTVDYLEPEVFVLDEAVKKDVDLLKKQLGAFQITNRTLDDSIWTIATDNPLAPATSYLYERKTGTVSKLFEQRPVLSKAPLVPMKALELKARDGLTLVSYLSLPPGSDSNNDGLPDKPVPMVLNVHGGPWGRDTYSFDNEHQWLANRGYAVLSVNFRASTGFGKNFTNAGNREWARKMHDDLLDAVKWAVDQKVTTSDKVAIYGGSYGGYATLVGMTMTPDTFACGVDIVGPSNIVTLMSTIPPYWKAFFENMVTRVGDPRTEEGKKFLAERSPLTYAGNIKKPLLIAQGANDPRVKQAEADQIVKAMKDKNLPVTYVLYPEEGHGFARPTNRTSFYAIAEGFLSQCLGGRYEPIGNDFKGANLKVLEGAQNVPGLADALK